MAGKTISVLNKVQPALPKLSFLLDDFGDLIGFEGPAGTKVFFPASRTDDSITASTSSDQAGGVAVNYRNTRVTTVGTAGDSLTLPFGIPGMSLVIINAAAANSMDVFPATGDAINALSANSAFAIAANKHVVFTCTALGRWHTNLTA